MQYDELCDAVRTRTDLVTSNEASTAITGTIELLSRRLAGGEPANLAAQLPGEIQETLTRHTGPAETFNIDEFLQRLADYEGSGCTPAQARAHARTVLAALGQFVSPGELDNIRSQLPAGYDALFPGDEPRRRPHPA